MKNFFIELERLLPPDFMATTRLKVLFKEQHLPHSFFEIQHPKAMLALQYISDFTKEVINLANKD